MANFTVQDSADPDIPIQSPPSQSDHNEDGPGSSADPVEDETKDEPAPNKRCIHCSRTKLLRLLNDQKCNLFLYLSSAGKTKTKKGGKELKKSSKPHSAGDLNQEVRVVSHVRCGLSCTRYSGLDLEMTCLRNLKGNVLDNKSGDNKSIE